jgi:3-methyl-2-oxobutanoate hydroxymethyltransferase
MPAITLTTLQSLKQKGEKITMLTCYDATFAHACNEAGVEVLLVGDSLGMVLQGHDSTLPVTTAEMAYHVACVKRGNTDALILADLPFMANATLEQTMLNSATADAGGRAHGQGRRSAVAGGVDPAAGRTRCAGLRAHGPDATGGEHSWRL